MVVKVSVPPLSNKFDEESQTKNQWLLNYFIYRESSRSQADLFNFTRSIGKNSSILADRYRGCLLGLAIGDALGTTLEFGARPDKEDLTEIVGGGPFKLKPGQWTDDTSMALCLAYSLLDKKSFDARNQMELYLAWWKDGLFSSTGSCFDIGNATARALSKFSETGQEFSGSDHERSAGNGSLMRLAPVPLFFASLPQDGIRMAGESSKTTHPAIECVDSCRYFSALILGALYGETKDVLLSEGYAPVNGYWGFHPLCEKVNKIALGSYKKKTRDEILSSGYVIDSLEAALWAFYNTSNFEDGLVKAVNLGGDSDTIGAIYGQLAGAFYGESKIPFHFIKKIHKPHLFYYFADELVAYYAGSPVFEECNIVNLQKV
ncbi:ADP-ribosylglycohydrolase family protein [Microbulbifer variabilis]|uniref:ADP-ribosylglycohydrolase family protein n=1 Tax=Microbulbifer variabilis TaxID=266805 RepID=A0ABY4V8M8_9GAMM|nr:ADP-ribosylglycohydrolase family protein [Microbulbifer variabilis]USD20644.1 ADP-ribosylglycohydrolase family protein [Microbulbifer variabilis]